MSMKEKLLFTAFFEDPAAKNSLQIKAVPVLAQKETCGMAARFKFMLRRPCYSPGEQARPGFAHEIAIIFPIRPVFSIHSPDIGRDISQLQRLADHPFSIHSSRKGRDPIMMLLTCLSRMGKMARADMFL